MRMAGKVCLDELVTVDAVYDDEHRWNGWLLPRMSRDAVETVMQALATAYAGTGERAPDHAWRGDALEVIEYDGDTPFPETLHPDEHGRYALGAGAWVWSTVE